MELIILLAIIILGLGLIIIEIVFIPGTTILGILGVLGIFFSFLYGFYIFGTVIGINIVVATVVISIIAITISLKANVWKRFSLDTTTAKSKINTNTMLKVGERGITLSTLRPFGNAEFGDKKIEVTTLGELIESGTKIEVIRIENRTIYVKLLKLK